MKKILFLVFLLLVLSTVSAQQIGLVPIPPNGPPGQLKQHNGRVIVRFRDAAQFLDGSGPSKALVPQLNLFVVDNPNGVSVGQALGRYKNNPNVIYAEPDYQVQVVDTPNDPMWTTPPGQWDMVKIAAPAAWSSQTDASDIVVAVIDTGIAYTHPDLAGNLFTDDAKGTYTGVAGAHGFTCMGSCVAGGADDFGHGSHVAGTIGAVGNDGQGMAGINWHVKLLSMKFLDSNGSGYISDAVLAFNKIAQLKQAGVNIRVTNNSWGGGDYTQALQQAMSTVEGMGILDVCAAGNSGANADSQPMYPAAYNNRGIISVAASDSSDAGASFSNIGLATVDIAAPGVSTISTVPIGAGACQYCTANGYNTLSGTSMATPHVSGVAAALFHISPGSTAEKMRDVILDPASLDHLADARLRVTSTVGGRLNFASAVGNPKLRDLSAALNTFPVLTPPSDVSAYGNDNVTLTASATGGDNDPLTLGWAPLISGSAIFSAMLNNIFPTPPMNTNPVLFKAASLSRTAFSRYTASVSDGRGGSDTGSANVLILPTGTHSQPTGIFSLSTHSIATGASVNLNFTNLTDPDGQQPIYWQAWFLSDSVWGEMCCLSSDTTTFNLPMTYAGSYRVSVQAINKSLKLSPKYTDVISVGGPSGTPPISATNVDTIEGVAPLTVNIDMTGSAPGGASISTYTFYCPDTPKTQSTPKASCTYPAPGNYYLWTTVKDANGLMDASKTYITVLPSSTPPPSPDFSLNPNPTSRTVTAGSSTTYSIGVTGSNGFNGSVSLNASGLPAGVNASFSPTSATPTTPSTMTVTTNNGTTTPAGTYTLTITGTSGTLTHTTSVSLVVSAPPTPDFSLSPNPTSRTVTAGGSTTYSVGVTASNGFNGSVSLSASGLPAGASASFNPGSATPTTPSTMTVTTNNGTTTPAGTYTLTITGTSGALTHMTTVTFVVNAAPPPTGNFQLGANPGSLTITRGSSKSTAITITPTGFSGSVTLTATGLPNGGSATFSPSSVSVSGSTSGGSTMTIKTSNGTKSNTYSVKVTGTGGGLTTSTTVTVIVP